MKIKYKRIFALCSLLILMSGCTTMPAQPQHTALEVRQYQTREYDLNDTRKIMKAVLNVLQDEGFVTKNAVSDLGLITASKEIDKQSLGLSALSIMIGSSEATWQKTEVIDATANVTEYGSRTKVRLTMHRKILDNRGGTMSVSEIQDPIYYQEFLTKIEHGVFLERARL